MTATATGPRPRRSPDARAEAGTAADPYAFVRAPRLPGLGGTVASTVGYEVEREAAGRAPDGRSTHHPGDPAREPLHRGLPSPYLTLIFSLHEPVVSGDTAEQARGPDAYRADVLLAGLHRTPAFVRRPRREAGVQLAVHPLAARALTGMPAAELHRLTADGADVLGAQAAQVRERLCALDGWDERFAVLTGYLRARTEHHAPGAGDADGAAGAGVRPEVAEAWRWLARHRGAASVDGLAAHVALSPRQLSTLFRREFGVGPKEAGRLMRFDHARRRIADTLRGGARLDLSAVAADCGFYDHPHLVRDFRQFTGLSPTAWIAEEHRNIQAGGHRNDEEWAP
ncbi:helix-turn-helix domain-containing protein [Streptomyces phytohabitans]|uniref:helix-turn-helix domain-containing protein n=1 Tax=Streptomyces phytohabitans TaxID=1150371 RepID=UPI00345BA21D